MSTKRDPFAPVIGLDIDGTSGDYHGHFTWFISQWLGREMPDPTAYTGGVPFHKHLGVSRATYNDAKLAYRQGGIKRWMPAYPNIGEFTKVVRETGAQVYICTTRPYLNLSNIDPDTRHWLRRAGMQYDGVLYGQHKYSDLKKAVGLDRIVCVFEDLPRLCDRADALGIRAFLRNQPYNQDASGNWTRVGSVEDMLSAFFLAWYDFNNNKERL